MMPTETDADYEALLKRNPYKGSIYHPTSKIPLPEKIRGVQRVIDIWEQRWKAVYQPALRALREKYLGRDRCFVIGNGPSLNETNLDLLTDEVTFGVNGIFLKFPETTFRPTFYVVEDHLVAEDRAHQIVELSVPGMTKLFPIYLAYCLPETPDTIFYNHRPRKSYPHGFDFSTDASTVTYTGCTVGFSCLQLAFYLGFKKIYLIGTDLSYQTPDQVQVKNEYNVAVLDMPVADPNHFHQDYFGKGFRFHDPQKEKMHESFAEAAKVTRDHDVQVFNATIGGFLEAFPRVDYYSLFG